MLLLCDEFVGNYVFPAIKANALSGGGYPLFTALARPLIAKLAVEHVHVSGCDTIAHGCTGKGNDQLRTVATSAAINRRGPAARCQGGEEARSSPASAGAGPGSGSVP